MNLLTRQTLVDCSARRTHSRVCICVKFLVDLEVRYIQNEINTLRGLHIFNWGQNSRQAKSTRRAKKKEESTASGIASIGIEQQQKLSINSNKNVTATIRKGPLFRHTHTGFCLFQVGVVHTSCFLFTIPSRSFALIITLVCVCVDECVSTCVQFSLHIAN